MATVMLGAPGEGAGSFGLMDLSRRRWLVLSSSWPIVVFFDWQNPVGRAKAKNCHRLPAAWAPGKDVPRVVRFAVVDAVGLF